jgi:hypothetical protein
VIGTSFRCTHVEEVSMNRVDAFKRTSDEWYPNYHELVKVSFCQTGPYPPENGDWRVCAWGNDDFGMEKDFRDREEAWACFLAVISLNDVTVDRLRELGFVPA